LLSNSGVFFIIKKKLLAFSIDDFISNGMNELLQLPYCLPLLNLMIC
jgi:hypothetical protein